MNNIASRIRRPARHVLAASVLLASGAWAAEPAMYVGLHAGANQLSDWSATVGLGGGVSLPGKLSLDSGGHVGIFAGRQTENARFELEYQAGRFDITAIQLGALRQNVSTSGRYQALTFNAYRTHPFSSSVTGYAALGIGWGSARLPQMGFTGGCNCFAGASKSGLAYLGRLGLEWKLAEPHQLFAQYTLLSLPKPAAAGTPSISYSRKRVDVLSVGYRYVF